jgi:hypothetical protein
MNMKNSFGFGFGLGAISLAAALLGGCGDLANVYTPANSAGYTPDGTLAIYTPAGIKLYDATLAMEQKSILLDPSSGGVLVDEPIAFDLAADGSAAAVGFSNTVKHDVAVINIPSGVPRAIIDVMMPKSQEGTFPVQGVALSTSPAGRACGGMTIATGWRRRASPPTRRPFTAMTGRGTWARSTRTPAR